MKRRWSMFVLVAALTACGTAGDISRNRPSFRGETKKLDMVYARCVQARWAAVSPSAHIVETPTALHVVVANAVGDTQELLVIHGKMPGAEAALYERVQILALRAYREAARDCL